MVERLFLAVPQGCLQFVIVVFPDHTHLLFFTYKLVKNYRANVRAFHENPNRIHTELIFINP